MYGINGASGAVVITLSVMPPPLNDLFSNHVSVCLQQVMTGSSIGGSAQLHERWSVGDNETAPKSSTSSGALEFPPPPPWFCPVPTDPY